MKQSKSMTVAITAMTAALYIALGYIFQPISFLGLQFRVAELLVGICVLFPWSGLVGNVIGVFFVNLVSPLGLLDLLSCLVNIPALICIIIFRNWKMLKYLGATLYACIISLYVAWIIEFSFAVPFWITFVQVLIAEEILACLGVFLFTIVKRAFEKE